MMLMFVMHDAERLVMSNASVGDIKGYGPRSLKRVRRFEIQSKFSARFST
jgi:hypothetical protein